MSIKLRLILKSVFYLFQNEFLQNLVKFSDNLVSNISTTTFINYRREYNSDDPFVSSTPGTRFNPVK